MLTPNDVRSKKIAMAEMLTILPASSAPGLLCKIYEEVLEEISKGSIDPKSLAIAALEPAKK